MRRPATAALVDVVAVTLFVAIGRASHHHVQTFGGFFSTLWPFAAGVGTGWIVTARRPWWLPRTGLIICVVTVTIGMVLRVIAGQGTAVSFILVALGFLGLVMVAGRALGQLVESRAQLKAPPSPSPSE